MENLEPAFVGLLDFRSGVFVRRFDMAMAVYTLARNPRNSSLGYPLYFYSASKFGITETHNYIYLEGVERRSI